MGSSTWGNTSVNATTEQQTRNLERSPELFTTSRVTLTLSLVISAFLLIAVMSVFLNSLLLWSLARVDHLTLRANDFLINLSLVNLIFPVVSFLQVVQLWWQFLPLPKSFLFCWGTISGFIRFLVFFIQPFCALGLACDRIYAVAKPLQYKLVGYSKAVRIALLLFPWLMSVSTGLGFVLAALGSAPTLEGLPVYCTLIKQSGSYINRSGFIHYFLTVTNVTSFLAYIAIFAILRYQRHAMKNTCTRGNKSNSMSLTITYFLSNVTSLALYLVGPLYGVFSESVSIQVSKLDAVTTAFGLAALYMCNTCLDPLILISRIPSIRNNLPIKQKPKRAATQKRCKMVNQQLPMGNQCVSSSNSAPAANDDQKAANRSVMG